MISLAFDIETSASLLNINSAMLEDVLKRKEIEGFQIGNEWRISVFVLSRILNTTPDVLLEYFEDYCLSKCIDEVEDEDFFTPEQGKQIYEKLLSEHV